MKYFLFDGGDVVGPFTMQQLRARPGFSSSSLICPEAHSEEDDFWKEAAAFSEFGFENGTREVPSSLPSEAEKAQEEVFHQEMSALVFEQDPLLESAQEKKKPTPKEEGEVLASRNELRISEGSNTRPSPIEDYFNNINADNLGDILGIPDPNENSEMNLARALNSHFPQEERPKEKEDEKWVDPFDEFTVRHPNPAEQKQIEEELPPEREMPPPAAPVVKQPKVPVQQPAPSVEVKPDPAKQQPQTPPPAPTSASEKPKPAAASLTPPAEPAPAPAPEPPNPVFETTIVGEMKVIDLDATEREQTAPPAEQAKTNDTIPPEEHLEEIEDGVTHTFRTEFFPAEELPAEQPERTEDDDKVKEILQGTVEVDVTEEISEPIKKVRPLARKEIKEQKKVFHELPEETMQRKAAQSRSKKRAAVFFLIVAVLVTAGAFFVSSSLDKQTPAKKKPAPQTTPKPADTGVFLPGTATTAPQARPTPAAPTTAQLVARAKEIVQKRTLPNGNVTIANYFDRIYKDKFAEGFTAAWSAEPLHQDVYIVKYRLTKTRKEPIMYIFQVDVKKGKITGALNNITIDLVGKIRE